MPQDTDSQPAIGQRGSLKFSTSTSTSQLTAGREFSIFVEVTNPFSIPVNVKSVSMILPSQFVDVDARARNERKKAAIANAQKTIQRIRKNQGPSTSPDRDALIEQFVRDLIRFIPMGSVISAGITATQIVKASNSVTPQIVHGRVSNSKEAEEIFERVLKLEEKSEEEIRESYDNLVKEALSEIRDIERTEQASTTLQPADTTVQSFRLTTNKSTFFQPAHYDLKIDVEYEVSGEVHRDVVPFQINVTAPIKAMISGAMLGSSLSYVIRDIFKDKKLIAILESFSSTDLLQWSILLFGNLLLAVVVVIVFARKKDSQPILSVEDFWGGVFVGVLAGYGGPDYLGTLLPETTATSSD